MNYRKGWKRAVSLLMTVVFLFYAAGYRNYSFATNGVTQSRTPAEINDFPAEYRAGLEAVKKAFPNAVFIKFDTGLDWSELFTSSSFFYPYRCTIPNSKNSSGAYNYPSSYKGIEFNNAFNFIENEWSVQEGGWTQASEALIRYYVDPRNFLSSEGIFSFLSTSYNEQLSLIHI